MVKNKLAKQRLGKEPPSLDLPVFKPSEVGRLLRLDIRTVYGMIESGTLPSIEAGRVIRIPGDAVRDLLKGRKPPSSEGPAPRKSATGD